MKARKISVNSLVNNPQRLQRGDETFLYKLRRHVESSGCYEPIVVRPHPTHKGKFEIINGHSRLTVLKALGHRSVLCVIWTLDEKATEVALATVNSLAGSEIPERRAVLVADLLLRHGEQNIADILPESKKKLDLLTGLAKLSHERPQRGNPVKQPKPYAIAAFKMDKESSRQLNLALELIARTRGVSHPEGLAEMAQFYLSHCLPIEKRNDMRQSRLVHSTS